MAKKKFPKEAPPIGDTPFSELVGDLVEVPIREGKEKRGGKPKGKTKKK